MTTYLVDNTEALTVPAEIEAVPGGYYSFNKDKLADKGVKVYALATFLKLLGNSVQPVVEYFGGIGIQAAVVRKYWPYARHTIYDLDPNCVAVLEANGFKAYVADCNALQPQRASLLLLDHYNMTCLRLSREPDWSTTYIAALWLAKYGVITDVAIGKFHLNKHIYHAALGSQAPLEQYEFADYVMDYSHWLYENAGHSVFHYVVSRRVTYLLTERTNKFEIPTSRVYIDNPTAKRYFQLKEERQ